RLGEAARYRRLRLPPVAGLSRHAKPATVRSQTRSAAQLLRNGSEERQGVLRLAARDDAVVPGRGYHLSFLEPGAGQHCRQLAARVLLAPGRPEDRHVECGDPERAGLVVVEERLVEEDPAARLERLEALL